MTKGFHIPYHFGEEEVQSLGRELLATGRYGWIEIKWPFHLFGFDPASYVRGVRGLVRDYRPGVSCHIPTNLDLGQTNTAMHDTVMQEAKLCIDYAAEFGATIMPLHPGTILTMDIPDTTETPVKKALRRAGEQKREQARALTVEIAQELAEYSSQYGMTVALENLLLPQEVAHEAQDLRDLVVRCGRDNIRALYDCGHSHRVGASQGEYIRTLGGLICHVHLNDNDRTCDLHQQMGEGTIDYGEMFAALGEVGYQGVLVMETSYHDSTDLLQSSAMLDAYLQRG